MNESILAAPTPTPAVYPNMHPFYNGKFAWLPIGIYKKGDDHNSAKIAVRWLFFQVGDAMSPHFDLDIGLDFNGFHIRAGIPWVNAWFRIPFPHKLDMWAHRNLWRVGVRSKFKWMR